jgi:hypothetical protein
MNRANAGLNDPIPLGLKNKAVAPSWKPGFAIPPKTAKNQIFRVFRVFRGLKNFLGEDFGAASILAFSFSSH